MPKDKILSNRLNPGNMLLMGKTSDSDINGDLACSRHFNGSLLLPPRRSSPEPSDTPRSTLYLGVITSFMGLLIICTIVSVPIYQESRTKLNHSGRKTILLWNEDDFFSGWSYLQCGCVVTSGRDYGRNALINAVVINADRPYSLKGLEKIKHTPHFRVVFATRNPLILAQNPLRELGKTPFNFTMSYRLDSDIIWTDYYFSLAKEVHRRVNNFSAPVENFMEKMFKPAAFHLRLQIKSKYRPVVYMMYEVNEYTLPESLYLEELRKSMDLDAIGTCHGYNECNMYQFMLIFDPSSCPDYVHPHFYMALSNYVVPVMIGGGNLGQLVPPGSYISSADFDSPTKLAEHLKELSAQPHLYEQFFWWHSKYYLHTVKEPYCELCRMVSMAPGKVQPKKFFNWWTQYQCPNDTKRLGWSSKGSSA